MAKTSPATYGIAGALVLALLALAGRYGPHRDELYFVVAGNHPQWGYPDQPPLTPLVAAASQHLAPGSLVALRLVPAVLTGLVVLLAAGLTRQLGGDRRAELLTAVTVATSAGVLAVGHLLSTSTIDLFFWVLLVRLLVAVVRRDEPRGWLAVGLVAGLGLQNKSLVAVLLAALLVGVVATTDLRHHLLSPWAWAGAVIALAAWAPNLAWQAAHGWPQLTLGADIRAEYGTAGGVAQLVGFQLLLLNPLGGLLAFRGLVALLRAGPDDELRRARPVAVAYLVLLAFFVVTGGKSYYLTPLLVSLAAAGAVALARSWSGRRLGWFSVAVVATAIFPLPAMLPVLPAATYAASFYPALNSDGVETIGWPQVVDQVRAVADALPPDRRARAVIVTQNYGEAGALAWYGRSLPPIYSGHNGFGDWGPPPAGAAPVIWVGQAPGAGLAGCRPAALLRTGADNEEAHNGIWVCAGPTGGWSRAWPGFRHLNA